MAKIAHSTTTPIIDGTGGRQSASPSRRAVLGSGILALVAAGLTAATMTAKHDPLQDIDLLSLRSELDAAVADMALANIEIEVSDERLEAVGIRLNEVCWAIVDEEPAQTREGLQLKAAAAMQHLRGAFDYGDWPGPGEEMAWLVLSEIAGDVYVPPLVGDMWASSEPGRA